MKVAMVRGSNMNPFEMQSYGPLASIYNITGYAGYDNHFELKGIGFPVKRLHTFEERYRPLPSPVKSIMYGLSLPRGLNGMMYGLEKELANTDLIHSAETSTGYSYQAARVKRELKKNLVITVWENIPFLSTHQFMGFDRLPLVAEPVRKTLTGNDHIVRYVKENADLFIAVTEQAKRALLKEGVPEDKIRVVYAGVDTSRFSPGEKDPALRRSLKLSDDDFVVLFIGRLVKEKGVHDLLQATKLVRKDVGNIKVVLVGDGPERKNIEDTIRSLGIEDNVIMAGSFPYGEVPVLYRGADAFVLPSVPMPYWEEQFGMVLVEAMASGLPVISTHCGSIPEVVGSAGMLVAPGDPKGLGAAMLQLVMDSGYRIDLGKAARKRAVDVFDIGKVSGDIASVYKEME